MMAGAPVLVDIQRFGLSELATIKEHFAKTLRSMLHSRIDYPKDEEKGSNGGGRKSDASRRSSGGTKAPEGGPAIGRPKNPTRRPGTVGKPASAGPGK